MKIILKLMCFSIAVFSAVYCEFCSNEKTGVKGECLSNAICEQNDPVYNGVCEAGRSCCKLRFFNSNCDDGFPTIFMLYTQNNATYTKLVCSGTLINSNYILTAAHCIDTNLPIVATIYGSDRQFKISNKFIFHGFANNETHRLNDVGILRLEEAIDSSVNAKTVCLPKNNKGLNDQTFVIYGIDRDTKTIKEATTAYDYYDCSDFLAKNKFNHTLIFEDSFCYNDASDHVPNFLSGSPLMIKDGKTYHQYGISSLGSLNREAGENVPAISPKLSIYQGWILKTVTD